MFLSLHENDNYVIFILDRYFYFCLSTSKLWIKTKNPFLQKHLYNFSKVNITGDILFYQLEINLSRLTWVLQKSCYVSEIKIKFTSPSRFITHPKYTHHIILSLIKISFAHMSQNTSVKSAAYWNYQSRGNPETGNPPKGIRNPIPKDPDTP